MSMTRGTRIGPYEIVAAIGAGGMGEVFRAHDGRLGRDVALKIISSDSPHDDRLWRFEQEARAVAALNHPNIVAIYDVDTNASTPFIVTELLDGESLRQRMDKGRLPPRKVRDIAEQIARGLAAAHDKRIAHRDLKPENVFVTGEGLVKILDFGLAKLASPLPVAAATATASPQTARGTVMGTVGYMSPEQVRGEEADHRSDIFSLGTVLYEMLSGRRLFAGNTSVETMSAILNQDPPDLPPADVPPSLERIVRRCLEKSAEERFQSARDLAFALSALSGSGATAVVSGSNTRRRLLPTVAIAAAVVVVAAAAAIIPRGSAAAIHPLHFAIPVSGEISQLALSRDGTQLAFVTPDESTGNNMLHVQRVGVSTAAMLPGTEGASYPFWSPDSAFLGFFSEGRLQKIRASGGPVQTIIAVTAAARGGTWSPSNVIVYAPAAGGPLWRVNADGTGASSLTDAVLTGDETSHRWPLFLPDGDRFVFWAGRFSKGATTSGLFASSLSKREKTRLITAWSNAGFAGDRFLVYVDEKGRLAMQPVDLAAGRLVGDAHVLADVVGFQPSVYWGAFAVSDTATVVSNSSSVASQSMLTWYNRMGDEIGTVGSAATIYNPALSPDGRRIAVDIADKKAANVDVWLLNTQGGTGARFTFETVEEADGVWSPDGSRIAYGSSDAGLQLKSTSGLDSERTLVPLPNRQSIVVPDSWSPDGKSLVVHVISGAVEPSRLFLVNVGEPKLARLLATNSNESTGQISPDGKWLAYASDESGEWNVYVTTFPGAAGKWQVSVDGGTEPRWRGDGKELFYLDAKNTLTAIAVEGGSTFASGPPQPLFRVRGRAPISNTDVYSYDVTKDGMRFIVNKYVKPSSVPPLDIFLNATAPQ